jgi:putative transposase
MILTYKIKHGRGFSIELEKARQVALFALKTKSISSKDVKHIGLKSMIANQILRKYSRNRKLKRVSKVNLIIPNQGIKVDQLKRIIRISCLDLELTYQFPNSFSKVNQVEINKDYIFVSVTVPENKEIVPTQWIGIDQNATRHCVVVANPSTGKVLKLGRKAQHTHKEYSNARKRFQKKGKLKLVKKIKNRESRIVRDLNHKISRKVVDYALKNKAGIVLEDLKGIRKTKKQVKSFRYSLHSWSFYQLWKMIEYKAKLLGIPVIKIDPAYTSQQCSRCGLLGQREGKKFKCLACGHVEDADVNAAFVIALRHQGILRLPADRDAGEGRTGSAEEATSKKAG